MTTRTLSKPADFVGSYGPAWRTGIVTDHVRAAVDAGATVRTPANGLREYVVLPDGTAVEVVCGELVWIDTDDGPIDGRCGIPVKAGHWACEGHGGCRPDDERYEQ